MDPPNKHTTVARMDIPVSGHPVAFVVGSTFLAFFVAVAISNLDDYETAPLYAIIFSVLWLLIVGTAFTVSIGDSGGLRSFITILLAGISAQQFVEIVPQQGDDLMVRCGHTLLGHDFNPIPIRRAELTSVEWRSGQTTQLAGGHDMNDWDVFVWYDRKGAKRWTSASSFREEAGVVFQIEAPKHEADALAGSLVDFFRSAGIELHPVKDKSEFTTRNQDVAD